MLIQVVDFFSLSNNESSYVPIKKLSLDLGVDNKVSGSPSLLDVEAIDCKTLQSSSSKADLLIVFEGSDTILLLLYLILVGGWIPREVRLSIL